MTWYTEPRSYDNRNRDVKGPSQTTGIESGELEKTSIQFPSVLRPTHFIPTSLL